MAKNYLVIKDNVIDKFLLLRTKSTGVGFYNSTQEVKELNDEVI